MRKSSILLLTTLLPLAAGCFLFHKESPQQQYTEALMRGNSMQASQVWLNMSPEDRMKFARGEGIQPDQTEEKKDVQQMLTNHYDNQSEEGPSNAEQMEEQMPTPLGASLKNLPSPSGSPSPAN
jgi:redox-sensitive bicupin YhaK (pirin superfamily)